MFGSVRLVQEVTRSNQPVTSPSRDTESHLDSSIDTPSTNTTITIITTTNSNDTNTHNNNDNTTNTNISDDDDATHTADNDTKTSITSNPNKENGHIAIDVQKQDQQKKSKYHSSFFTKPLKTPRIFNKHSATSSASSPSNPPLIPKTHTRRNSKYNIRHHRARQPSFSSLRKYPSIRPEEERNKRKSQKLLCLWPLPIVTRYMILIALFVSTLNFLNIIHLSCAAPSFVIYRSSIKSLLLSPFLVDWTLPSIVLYGWNILVIGLFEESLAHMVGGTRRFVQLLITLFTTVSALRIALGYLFTKSTGWAVPSLFFSNAIHECNQGLAPFLFALVVVQSLSINDKYILIYGHEESNHKLTVRKVTLQLMMSLVNYTSKNILWWSLSGLLTGFIITVILQAFLAFEKREDSGKVKDMTEFITLEHYRRTPLWRLILSAIKKCALVVTITVPILMAWNAYYTREVKVTPAELNTVSQDRYLFTFVFMTAPRRGDPAYLTRTLESYLANWPENPPAHSPYHRMQAIVYTHFSNHSQFDVAKAHFSDTVKGQKYLKWIREEGNELNQRLHVSKALTLATDRFESTYYALMEDDFPVCGPREWHEIEKVIYTAQKMAPNHCGIFVGTGGSGLFLKPELARLTSQLLLKYAHMPPDIIIQQCLLGHLPECSACADSLVTSKTLLMYHIGYNTSTSEDRVYKKNEFQCGWRHPFNGDPSVITL
ncbi:hypothetical protein BCV72DRAFT_306362 [Rhizopus microsporus var. microsporus]|uniref:Uncharacterized protein n=2 Tax=Rhizopus microsporus TaxID=58291 RepID=A0A2G4SIB3_RHIZD|nr:uncharacterized protein RHIMIDRAFT_241532 [Rhizopus microsporus ATCC 52813]ORE05508.1 hypothetical protein BCV72DRAFT_306362 [Rhizopus microsporus var. microsporus]PHZ08517.1 hypothetical protein RHIMIDRAFT_241532 [Rhizopus microsporus ATCC 52813]